ncbi:MAG: TIGR04552 family protein [Deltaproteobacteria bacterium]|nr:TIGR04552 family protein [Deltaproteobacteria bacterium]
MTIDRTVHTHHPDGDPVPLARFSRIDVDSVLLLLRGSSVVDWITLHVETDPEIDAFLRVNELDPDDPRDRARFLRIRDEAVRYLREHLAYKVPPLFAETDDMRLLFRKASGVSSRRSERFFACLMLKVMHVVHHAEAQELLNVLPLSQAELAILVQAKVERVVRGMLERKFPIVLFSGNRKTRNSVLSKLLAKKDTQSAQIFDKLRFRFVVERREDVPPLVLGLVRELLPVNYVVPLQTHNSLVDFDAMLRQSGNRAVQEPEHGDVLINEPLDGMAHENKNEFSGPDYRVVNFVADVPLRVDRYLPRSVERLSDDLGRVVFAPVEFQVVDRQTDLSNESGENRHSLYKARQRTKVRQRLERGKRQKREIEAPRP